MRTHAGLGEQAGAKQVAEKLRDLGWDSSGNAYDAARALALCIPIVEKAVKLPTEQRTQQVQFYGDQAMTMLRDAVAKGWKDAAHMKKDNDLGPLCKRDDFQKLLAEVGKPGNEKKP